MDLELTCFDTWIISEKGNQAVSVGEMVNIGGGFVSADVAGQDIGQPIPEDYGGPYWLASFEVSPAAT